MSSISLGVGALVAIDSFSENITRSIHEQSRALVGGDLALTSRQPFNKSVQTFLDSISKNGVGVARSTQFMSMAVVPRTAGTRLVQIRAVTTEYPFYGVIETEPAGRWSELQSGAHAIVDKSLLTALDARIGDSLSLGFSKFLITGTIISVPGDPGISAAIGPRVFIPARYTAETQLLVMGSRAEYEALLKLPDNVKPGRYMARFNMRLDSSRVRQRTVAEAERDLTSAIGELRDFLGIVGLVALLLGGIGVASGIHAFVAKKIDTVAVLRCLGATSRQAVAIYVTQAVVMGTLGAAAGAVLGVGVQFIVPQVMKEFIPVDVNVRLEPMALSLGLIVGLWVALIFALRPLIGLRHVSPLQTLRRETDAQALRLDFRDWARLALTAATAGSIVLLAVARSRSLQSGFAVSVSIAVVIGVLASSAALMTFAARRLLRARWPFVVRQGIANLYRPANQTGAVILALGFGVFLISTLYQVQSSLLRQITMSADATRANTVFFDVQQDQAEGLLSVIRAGSGEISQSMPIVQMRVAKINDVPVADFLKQKGIRRNFWAYRREYRSTYRDTIVSSEKLVQGRWFASTSTDSVGEVSMEAELFKDMKLALGDIITWDVQGVMVPVRVTSLREVNWARFEPNFFAVFSTRSLERAPRQYVVTADVRGAGNVGKLQRAVVDRYPNISSLDLSLVQTTIRSILRRVTSAVRFMAVLSLLLGVPVLFSAVAATRRDRVREGVLLKTLGATRAQVRMVMLSEYALLGLLGSLTGMLLSIGGAWALVHFLFEAPFVPAILPALAIMLSMMSLTVVIGVLAGRDVFASTPMAALRES